MAAAVFQTALEFLHLSGGSGLNQGLSGDLKTKRRE
jgi:hypothetical protein